MSSTTKKRDWEVKIPVLFHFICSSALAGSNENRQVSLPPGQFQRQNLRV
jgi:hypothetical protein